MKNAAEDLWTTSRDNTWGGGGHETHNHKQKKKKDTHARLNCDTSKTNGDTSAYCPPPTPRRHSRRLNPAGNTNKWDDFENERGRRTVRRAPGLEKHN